MSVCVVVMALLRNLFFLCLLASPVVGEEKPTNAVKRVINLLSEMKAQLESEAASDQELHVEAEQLKQHVKPLTEADSDAVQALTGINATGRRDRLRPLRMLLQQPSRLPAMPSALASCLSALLHMVDR